MRDEDVDAELTRLIAAHPMLFRGGAPAAWSYVSAGWYEIVDRLCLDIEALLGEEDARRFDCLQIKEKVGTLRFHWRYGASRRPRIDLLTPEGPRSLGLASAQTGGQADAIRRLVDAACNASGTICETCGRPGTLVCNEGWYLTRCSEHNPSAG